MAVRQRIIAQAEHAGANMVQIGLNRRPMPHALFMNQIERFAKEGPPILQAWRDNFLRSGGDRMHRFWNADVQAELESVVETIFFVALHRPELDERL